MLLEMLLHAFRVHDTCTLGHDLGRVLDVLRGQALVRVGTDVVGCQVIVMCWAHD